MNSLITTTIESAGPSAPWLFVALFVASSFLMIWRLEAMNAGGMEGTVLGTLIMPYCSGIGNLMLAFVIGRKGGSGSELMTNAVVNNVTNMTLLIGLPALIWGMTVVPESKSKKKKNATNEKHRINRLSLLLTLSAVFVFTGAVWALGRDGRLDFNDGLVLVGLFLFWQTFHVFEVLKSNVRQRRSFGWMLPVDLLRIPIFALSICTSVASFCAQISVSCALVKRTPRKFGIGFALTHETSLSSQYPKFCMIVPTRKML